MSSILAAKHKKKTTQTGGLFVFKKEGFELRMGAAAREARRELPEIHQTKVEQYEKEHNIN